MKTKTSHPILCCSSYPVLHSSTYPFLVLALIIAFAAGSRALPPSGVATPEGLTASDWANLRQQAYVKASNPGGD